MGKGHDYFSVDSIYHSTGLLALACRAGRYCLLKARVKLINKATGGAQQHINKDIVNDYCIMLPNEDILTEFRKKIKPVFNAIRNYLLTIEKLTEARNRLLPKLMSGEINV